MGNIQVTFFYNDGFSVNINRISLKACLNFVYDLPKVNKLIYLKIEDKNLLLYHDDHIFQQFMTNQIKLDDLIAFTKCDGCYRNIMDACFQDCLIDSGSLWLLRNQKYTLVDDDRHLQVMHPDSNFELI